MTWESSGNEAGDARIGTMFTHKNLGPGAIVIIAIKFAGG